MLIDAIRGLPKWKRQNRVVGGLLPCHWLRLLLSGRLRRPDGSPAPSGGFGNSLAAGGADFAFLRGWCLGFVELGPPVLLRGVNSLAWCSAHHPFLPGNRRFGELRRNVAAVAPGMYRRKPSAEKVLTGYPFDSAEMHHRPSHCWTWPTVSAATSDRRSPQPRRTARIARSRRPLVVVASGAFSSACACRTESPMWTLPPVVFRDFTLDARVWHP